MNEHSLFTVVAFDVANDKRRRRLVKVLESFGERAQESVFEIWLTANERKKLERRALACLKLGEDRLAFYALSKADRQDIISIGHGNITPDFTYWQP